MRLLCYSAKEIVRRRGVFLLLDFAGVGGFNEAELGDTPVLSRRGEKMRFF